MQEVGRHYLEDSSFMLYRIDGTKNDILHPGESVCWCICIVVCVVAIVIRFGLDQNYISRLFFSLLVFLNVCIIAITTAGVKIAGYPTLYFFPAHSKSSPLEYDGERTLEAMLTFIDAFKQETQQPQVQTGRDGLDSSSMSEVVVDVTAGSRDMEEVGRQQQMLAEQKLSKK